MAHRGLKVGISLFFGLGVHLCQGDPNLDLVRVAESPPGSDERESAKLVRSSVERGGSPLFHVPNSKRTILEVFIAQKRSLIVEALFEPPSPIGYDALEERIEFNPTRESRRVDKLRTKIARQAIASLDNRVWEVLSDNRIFVFAQDYIGELSLLMLYLTVVVLLVHFLYQLRIKQLPNPDVLLSPREETSWWTLLSISLSTLFSSLPTSSVFEIIGYGLSLVGGIVWSQLWTNRTDVALLLTIAAVAQTIFTLVCYICYAPMASAGEESFLLIQPPRLQRVMMYPKKSDWNRATVRSCVYLLACFSSFFVLINGLDPVRRMYDCPTPTVGDTYGFDYSVTRSVAVIWDIQIYFVLALRFFRFLDTVSAFELINRLLHVPSLKASDKQSLVADP